jgi:tRNA(Ile)-lysidine synthase
MEIEIEPGTYVAAVSGGVDSMVLLDMLTKMPEVHVIVAHFDHGIRPDSDEDRKLVEAAAGRYGLPFVSARADLGPDASEATAREARYGFLYQVRRQYDAKAIITAHHQDDLLETAILNVLRGTGRKGLASLQSTEDIVRPLLSTTKEAIRRYAAEHRIAWREDSTNADDRYARNYVRHSIVPRLNETARRTLIGYIGRTGDMNPEIDSLLLDWFAGRHASDELDRRRFAALPHAVACEVMAAWLRYHGVREFDRKTIGRLVVAAKTDAPGKLTDIDAALRLETSAGTLYLRRRPSRKTNP